MNRAEADQLARRIVSTWRSTAVHGEWVDALVPLDAAAASATVTKLRDEIEQGGLLVGRFMARYRTVVAPARRSPPCGRCLGDRWVECTDERRHGPGCKRSSTGSCACHAVVPCPSCTTGHPLPPRNDPPLLFSEYLARCLARGDTAEVARWERRLATNSGAVQPAALNDSGVPPSAAKGD